MNKNLLSLFAAAALFAGCHANPQTPLFKGSTSDSASTTAAAAPGRPVNTDNIKVASAATILSRKQVPVLCYHQIRDWKATDSKSSKDYIIPVETFKAHIKM